MKTANFLRTALFLSLTIFGSISISSQVQIPTISFVSANGGADANNCSRSAPCRQIQRGINNTSRGGTVVVLDSGEYQAFTITKSINVIAEKGVSAIVRTVPNVNGASIEEDGTNSQTITIRGLTFLGNGNGNSYGNGISVNAAITSLTVEDCSITSAFHGIYVAGAGRYAFKNITVAHSVFSGVVFTPGYDTVVATIEDSSFAQNGTIGVDLVGTNSSLTVRNSLAAYNPTGFSANSGKMFLENSVAANNAYGIISQSSATVSVGNSTITHNGTGFRNYSSTFRSFGNNSFANNSVANTSGTIALVGQQ